MTGLAWPPSLEDRPRTSLTLFLPGLLPGPQVDSPPRPEHEVVLRANLLVQRPSLRQEHGAPLHQRRGEVILLIRGKKRKKFHLQQLMLVAPPRSHSDEEDGRSLT